METRQEQLSEATSLKLPRLNHKQCEDNLKFLDYLRKSRCTLVEYGRDIHNDNAVSNYQLGKCKKTLDEMTQIAKDCYKSFQK